MSFPKRIRAHVHDLCPQPRIRTTDAARRSRDTLLSAETTARNPAMLGRVWAGDVAARISELSSADRAIALDEAQRALAAYGQRIHASGTMGPGNAGSLATDRPEMEFNVSTDATPEDLNGAAKTFWDRANRSVTRDVVPPRGGTGPVSIDDINNANRDFWQRQTAHQKAPAREWGKG
jgi:hypothetical protein